jgi:hypothetical protein
MVFRITVVLGFVLLGVLTAASPTNAAPKMMCTISPFESDVRTVGFHEGSGPYARLEFMAMSMAEPEQPMLRCGDRVMGIDVWEHAYYVFRPANLEVGEESNVRGQVRLMLHIGERSIPLQGQLDGMAECGEETCVFKVALSASGPGGSKLDCQQQGIVDAADYVVWRKIDTFNCDLLLGFGT